MRNKYVFAFSILFLVLGYNSIAQCLPNGSTYSQNDFGNNEWIAHTYDYDNGANSYSFYDNSTFDTISHYQGYYIDAGYGTSGISFNSTSYFATSSNPSAASTYVGCPMSDSNTYNVVYKRKGFPAAPNYVISMQGANGESGYDDAAQLYIDGSLVWSTTTCCNTSPNVWYGALDADSEVIFMWSERGGQSYGRMVVEGIPEDTSFGNFEWQVGVYEGSNFDTYHGYYTQTGVSFDTRNLWSTVDNPSDAAGYIGADVASNEQHSYVYRREGFDCGYYNLDILRHDDAIEVIIDGVTVYQRSTWDANSSTPNVWEGYLDGSSQVEIRMQETGGNSLLAIDLTATFGQANDPNEYIWIGGADTDPTNAANWCDAVPP
ncbi:hypothetical protein SAMN04488096_1371, partial [Mesonia phycicola]